MCGCLFIEKERLRPGSGENLTVRQWDFHIYSLAVRKKNKLMLAWWCLFIMSHLKFWWTLIKVLRKKSSWKPGLLSSDFLMIASYLISSFITLLIWLNHLMFFSMTYVTRALVLISVVVNSYSDCGIYTALSSVMNWISDCSFCTFRINPTNLSSN